MIKTIENNPVITIIFVVAAMLLFSFPYLEVSIMEARNFITAREMITDGNWILTTMNGEARYEKPPLPTWLTAVSAILFGTKNIIALRLPGILMVIIIGITSFKFSQSLISDRFHAFVNALITITSFYIIAIIIEAPWDIFTHGFMFIAICYLYKGFDSQNTSWKPMILAGIFIGLSILCKGPISLFALFLPFMLAYGIAIGFKGLKTKLWSLILLLVMAIVVGGWWYLYVRIVDPEIFIEIANRETENWSNYNVKPIYYYWSFFTQSGIWTIPALISLLYPYMKSRVINIKIYRFTFFWTIFAVLLLSLIPEKKSRYLMPVLIPLALNTGFYIEYLIRRFKDIKHKKEGIPVYFNFGLIALIGITFGIAGFFLLRQNSNINWLVFSIASIVLFFIGLLIVHQLKRKEIKMVFYLTLIFVISAFIFVTPITKDLKASSYHSIEDLKSESETKGLAVYVWDGISPEMIWHYGDNITVIKQNDSTFRIPMENKFGLLIQNLNDTDKTFLNESFHLEKITTFDLNITSPESRSYNTRLVNDYYIVSRR